MKWYFAFNAHTEEDQFPLIRMAVNSARRYTGLEPNCIISGPPGLASRWLENQGVRVHFRDVRVLDDFVRHKAANPDFDLLSACGAYLRLEIGELERDDQYVLYTDTDVMFRSLDGIETFRPWIVSMAPEGQPNSRRSASTGIMVINVPRFRRWVDRIYELARANPSAMGAHDQTAILRVLRWRWQRLPPEFNWKPYWGYSEQAKIVHWHGPKPWMVEKLMAGDTTRIPSIHQRLYHSNQAGYRAYLPVAQELAGNPDAACFALSAERS